MQFFKFRRNETELSLNCPCGSHVLFSSVHRFHQGFISGDYGGQRISFIYICAEAFRLSLAHRYLIISSLLTLWWLILRLIVGTTRFSFKIPHLFQMVHEVTFLEPLEEKHPKSSDVFNRGPEVIFHICILPFTQYVICLFNKLKYQFYYHCSNDHFPHGYICDVRIDKIFFFCCPCM